MAFFLAAGAITLRFDRSARGVLAAFRRRFAAARNGLLFSRALAVDPPLAVVVGKPLMEIFVHYALSSSHT